MKFVVDSRLLAFVLLNSLRKTLEWNMFTSVINTVEDSKLIFNAVETQITLEDMVWGFPTLDSTLKVSNKSSAHLPNATTWCNHHQQSGHNSDNCYAYQCWTKQLRKGGRGRKRRRKPMQQRTLWRLPLKLQRLQT
ncbi:hypothetical protein PAXRUDRAFT_176163 [Paxillus rubicundulus Ve08.2h10]|uniref:Uncharacterized protein n=1 Tax=Paxillus rubicundulus Ve08.2h10 TaxID=930991 RepID=A0A0D0CTF2_9AGAM|nr:hypothetical protein PAXRUDRAFT_176163 [Paxillus rubicundulus Ve08.2h10]